MITGNKGEWSEIYVLFKLLGDKNLIAGDADLRKVEDLIYPIIKIIRSETLGDFEYVINGDLVIVSDGVEIIRKPVIEFSDQAVELLERIKVSTGIFSLPDVEAFMHSVKCHALKARSTAKTDIRIVIHDKRISQTAELGFSIKSKLGGDSTLLNAGRTTNFIYRIIGFNGSDSEIERINSISSKSKIKDRIFELEKLGGKLQFVSPENDVFKNNLILVDSFLPNILSEYLIEFFTSNYSKLSDLTKVIKGKNPLSFDTQFSHLFYEYKIKRFLTDVALGMMPSKVWSGMYDATGGYLIVKEDGEILCYHIYNRNQFENYLFHNTKLETASSRRHDFGVVFRRGGDHFFKLNLQIRFM